MGSRLAAYLLDWLVMFILVCVFLAVAGLVLLLASDMGRRDPSDRAIDVAIIIASLVVPVWLVLTFAGWSWQGRSVGKLAMNLRIVNRRGLPPGPGRSAVRLLVYVVENLPLTIALPIAGVSWLLRAHAAGRVIAIAAVASLALPLVSLLLALGDRAGRTLHDRAAGTHVIAE
jgi:uncharacterized RDD family membrane protein YckC